MPLSISKSRFKARALELFRQVERSGQPVIITDRGTPVLKVIPYRDDPREALRALRDTVRRYDAPTRPVAEDDWGKRGMMLLDTHALVWWVAAPRRLAAKARRSLDRAVDAGEALAASSISIWELAMLVQRGRLELSLPVEAWIAAVEALPLLQFVPVDNRIAARAVALPGFPHRDPADRMILATALGLGATLVTADARLRAYREVESVWA